MSQSRPDFSKVLAGFEQYPKANLDLEYGTAGFRTKATILDHVVFRVGIVAHLRSMLKKQAIGLMITASHNLQHDNGVKIVDPLGDMLEQSWEKVATELVNCEKNDIEEKILSVINSNGIDISNDGLVLIGWDTRPSSERLVRITCEGICSLNGVSKKIGICTTPVLHFVVRCHNDPQYGDADIDGYYKKLVTPFEKLWTLYENEGDDGYSPEIHFDGANGVGSLTMNFIAKKLSDKIRVNVYNTNIEATDQLNYHCGADFVKSSQTLPESMPNTPYLRLVSFDGDADRIVYYFVDEKRNFHLLDGDRMATLIATFLREIIREAGLEDLKLGIVQTAYANGSSTVFIKETLKTDVSCVKTGVKYLHQEALKYDIGIYFEANGHGTVIFSMRLKDELQKKLSLVDEKTVAAANTLALFIGMVNETIGDALSDLLIVETILHAKNWNLRDWEKLYDVLPYQMSKVVVKNRSVITTTDAERRCVTPVGLQSKIDEAVSNFKCGRAFVRPSGTEDIVRVYAEAASQAEANELASQVSLLVYELAGGVGERPK